MRTILYLIRKEFIQIFRNKFIGRAIFGVPIVQLLILVPAVTFEIKSVRLVVIDRDMTSDSRGLISQLEGSTFFKLSYSIDSRRSKQSHGWRKMTSVASCGIRKYWRGQACRTAGFSKRNQCIQCAAVMGLSQWGYPHYNMNIIAENISTTVIPVPQIVVTNRYWYNECLIIILYASGVRDLVLASVHFQD
jgi:ABC-2 type transport system permease protein